MPEGVKKPALHFWHYGLDTVRFQNDWGAGSFPVAGGRG
jgi:hypothetical protein